MPPRKRMMKGLSRLKEDSVAMLVSPEGYAPAFSDALGELSEDAKGIVILTSMPFSTARRELSAGGVNMGNLAMIDASGRSRERGCIRLSSPFNMTEIGVKVAKLSRSGKYDFLYLDSLGTMMLYNNPARVQRFVHFLLHSARARNMRKFLTVVDGTVDRGTLASVKHFYGKVLKI